MIFKIQRASHLFGNPEERDIQTLEDLRKLAEEYAPPGYKYEDLIIDFGVYNDTPNITIYDDYIE